jgi:quercetin dioxygenase-like cupin family protein
MIVRLFTGDDGQSHFEEMEAPTEEVHRVATKPGEDLVFRRSAENSFSDWHHPSRRQYLFVIEGSMEVTVGDGTTRQFNTGDVLLAEDLTGQGHVTKSVGGSYTSVSMGIPD